MKFSHLKAVLPLFLVFLTNGVVLAQVQPPVPLLPQEGALVDTTIVWLEWEEVPSALGYEVQVGPTCEEGESYPVPETRFRFEGLQVDLDYFWRVRARLDSGGWGDYCPCAWFTTGLLGPGAPQSPQMGY